MLLSVISHATVIDAIADPARRTILDTLRAQDGQTITQLGTYLPQLGRHAVLKHVSVLESANLVTTQKIGRHRHCYLNPVPLVELAQRWLDDFGMFWGTALTDLRRHFDEPKGRIMTALPQHVYRIVINAQAQKIWEALTSTDDSVNWYFGTVADSTWRPGDQYTYANPDGSIASEGTIEIAEPPHRLVMTFQAKWDEDVSADPPSRMTWLIEPEEGMPNLSTVTIIHEDLVEGSATADQIDGARYLLANLKTYLETGSTMQH